MKVLFTIFLLFCLSAAFAQDEGKYSIGVGATPSLDGVTFAFYANRHINKHWQVGLMPFGWVNNHSNQFSKYNGYSIGLNLNTRFTPVEWRFLQPYTYLFVGAGHTKSTFETINYSTTDYLDFTNVSMGLGTQIKLGSKGWSIDANGGYLWYNSFNSTSTFGNIIYSIGIFKRF